MNKRRITFFLFLTFLLTWVIEIPAALASYGFVNIKVPHGLQTIATLSPGIVALLMIIVYDGRVGLQRLLQQVIKFRVSFGWYAFVLLTGSLLAGLSFLIYNLAWNQNCKVEPLYNLFFYSLIFLFFSPLWEEIGWRGYLLPRMQERFSPIKSALIIGFVWGIWHLPIYLAINPYGDKTILFFIFVFIGCFPISIIQTWIYNSTKGNILLCILFHDGINAGISYFFINLPPMEFIPFIITTALLICLASVIYFHTRGRLGGEIALSGAKSQLPLPKSENIE